MIYEIYTKDNYEKVSLWVSLPSIKRVSSILDISENHAKEISSWKAVGLSNNIWHVNKNGIRYQILKRTKPF